MERGQGSEDGVMITKGGVVRDQSGEDGVKITRVEC
jgi:hypothetical protein